jgi:hypothetical protein
LAVFRVSAGQGRKRKGETLIYRMDERTPHASKRKEEAFLARLGDEVTEKAADADLPFEAVTAFIKKAARSSGKAVSLFAAGGEADEGWRVLTKPGREGKGGSLMDKDKIQFEEAKLIAEEIAKRNRDFLPDEEEEIVTPDELENLLKGE